MKKNYALAALFMLCSLGQANAQTQDDDENFSYNFVGLQVGAGMTFTNADHLKLISPIGGVQLGRYFIPEIGARLSVQGGNARSGYEQNGKDNIYTFNYIQTNADLLLNISQMVKPSQSRVFNFALVGGVGFTTAWHRHPMDNKLPNVGLTSTWGNENRQIVIDARVGGIFDFNISRHWGINLEVDGNVYGDKWNGKESNRMDWELTAMVGVNYKFGLKKKVKPAPVADVAPQPQPEQWATRIDTTWYDDTEYEDVTRDREIKKEIFFGLANAEVGSSDDQIAAVAEFLKGVKDGEITITSYADKGTGTAKVNMAYSKKRAQATKQALIDKGVDASMIKSVEWKGDTVQPYEENDKNRLSVITGHGVYTDKEAKTVKKFRTKEVRYRVK